MATNKGLCDFRCWFAHGKVCRCECAGKNHGLGKHESDDPVFNELMKDGDARKYGFSQKQYNLQRDKMNVEK